jgi:hypothetical protein
MNVFIRVELHQRWAGDKPDYDQLHTGMSGAGCDRYVYLDGVKLALPTGTYVRVLGGSLPDIRTAVMNAVAKTGHDSCGILTRGDETLAWELKPMPTPALTNPFFSSLFAAPLEPEPRNPFSSLFAGPPAPPPSPLKSLLGAVPTQPNTSLSSLFAAPSKPSPALGAYSESYGEAAGLNNLALLGLIGKK